MIIIEVSKGGLFVFVVEYDPKYSTQQTYACHCMHLQNHTRRYPIRFNNTVRNVENVDRLQLIKIRLKTVTDAGFIQQEAWTRGISFNLFP